MSDSSSAVPVIDSPGRLPRFRQRDTVFVANLMALFFGNEEETRMLAQEVGELDSYGGRLIPILNLLFGTGDNLLLLERPPSDELCAYFQNELGLSLPGIEILPHSDYVKIGLEHDPGPLPFLEKISGHVAGWIDGYVTDDILASFARRVGKKTVSTPAGSREGNNKRLLHQYLDRERLPVVPTELAGSPGELRPCLARLRDQGFTAAVVKASIGASGIGMHQVPSLAACDGIEQQIPEHFFFEGPCLVQGWLQPGEMGVTGIRSPSVQLYLDDECVTQYDLTEQILSRQSVHEGNESPPPYLEREPDLKQEMLRQGAIVGRWLHQRGYRGTASADFLVVDYESRPEVYVCEINARVTGATYPTLLARHFLPEGSWLLRNLRFSRPLSSGDLLDSLGRSGDLFVPGETDTGVIPVNFNFGRDRLVQKGQFLFLASNPGGGRLQRKLAELKLTCEIDRD